MITAISRDDHDNRNLSEFPSASKPISVRGHAARDNARQTKNDGSAEARVGHIDRSIDRHVEPNRPPVGPRRVEGVTSPNAKYCTLSEFT